ncbi:hypothetical protein [uncultured Victivallis sp.]|uniref:hypothetical protein n=1 Tax=uncultured Victivallis sp. TaxID=354118 RepID=UPI002598479E|nr:hypothetical protein [uncultured Victivallis sp.]
MRKTDESKKIRNLTRRSSVKTTGWKKKNAILLTALGRQKKHEIARIIFVLFTKNRPFFLNFEGKRAESSKLHEIARNRSDAVAISGIGCMVKHRFERGNFNAGQKQHSAILQKIPPLQGHWTLHAD